MNADSAMSCCDRREAIAVCSAHSELSNVRLYKRSGVAAAVSNGAAGCEAMMSNNMLSADLPKRHTPLGAHRACAVRASQRERWASLDKQVDRNAQ
jgi:hypothetical protein